MGGQRAHEQMLHAVTLRAVHTHEESWQGGVQKRGQTLLHGRWKCGVTGDRTAAPPKRSYHVTRQCHFGTRRYLMGFGGRDVTGLG